MSALAPSRNSAVYWRGSTCATETPSWSVLPPLEQSALGVAMRAVHVFVPAAVAFAVISKRTQLSELVAEPKTPAPLDLSWTKFAPVVSVHGPVVPGLAAVKVAPVTVTEPGVAIWMQRAVSLELLAVFRTIPVKTRV